MDFQVRRSCLNIKRMWLEFEISADPKEKHNGQRTISQSRAFRTKIGDYTQQQLGKHRVEDINTLKEKENRERAGEREEKREKEIAGRVALEDLWGKKRERKIHWMKCDQSAAHEKENNREYQKVRKDSRNVAQLINRTSPRKNERHQRDLMGRGEISWDEARSYVFEFLDYFFLHRQLDMIYEHAFMYIETASKSEKILIKT